MMRVVEANESHVIRNLVILKMGAPAQTGK